MTIVISSEALADTSGGQAIGVDEITDGRQLRRRRNREAVVDALLELSQSGDLHPSTEQIAARPVSSRARSSATSTMSTTSPGPPSPGSAARHCQPILAAEVARNRALLHIQTASLFDTELDALDPSRAKTALAAADVLTSYEAYRLLTHDQALSSSDAKLVMVDGLCRLRIPTG